VRKSVIIAIVAVAALSTSCSSDPPRSINPTPQATQAAVVKTKPSKWCLDKAEMVGFPLGYIGPDAGAEPAAAFLGEAIDHGCDIHSWAFRRHVTQGIRTGKFACEHDGPAYLC
jgi:hypothetical protein